ncbi:DUF59 domain-containing protein [Candidatus Gottesmanbacteria bacterium]|nr:DUF59 domain-containing protein [Candidatus Gottesmanbacteria bacterium]
MLSKAQVLSKLKTVIDPELQVNIVDLGLVYGIEIVGSSMVKVKMTLTSPGCPLSFVFDQLVSEAVKTIKGVSEVKVHLTFDPPWDPAKMSEEVKLKLGWMG